MYCLTHKDLSIRYNRVDFSKRDSCLSSEIIPGLGLSKLSRPNLFRLISSMAEYIRQEQ